MYEDFNLRGWLAGLPGGAGTRNPEDMQEIKVKLAAMMYHIGQGLYYGLRAGRDAYNDAHVLDNLKDIDTLLNELLIHDYEVNPRP